MSIYESLKSVLCTPEGIVCIEGTHADLKIIQDSLNELVKLEAARKINAERIAELESVIKEGFKIFEFYGDTENWRNPTHPKGNVYNQLDSEYGTDLSQFNKGKILIAGALCRQHIEKHKTIFNEVIKKQQGDSK